MRLRIKQQLFCPVCNRVVERSELVKGYEISKGQYVQLTEADLDQLEAAESQHYRDYAISSAICRRSDLL